MKEDVFQTAIFLKKNISIDIDKLYRNWKR